MNELEMQKYVLQHSTGNLYWKGVDGCYLGCNAAFSRIAGLSSPADIVGKSDRELFVDRLGEAGVAKLIAADNIVLQQGIEQTLEEEGVDDRGKIARYVTRKSPIKDLDGSIVGLVGSSIDVTKEREMEKEKLHIDFIHNIEHDIRTPFCGIIGAVEWLSDQEIDPDKKSLLGDVSLSAKELLDYCNRLLRFSRDQENVGTEKNTLFDVRQLLHDIIAMQLPAARIKNIDLLLHCSPDVPSVLIGPFLQLKQMLINLISNAIKFTDAGHVKVTVQLDARKTNDSDLKKCYVLFRIEDTGIGIPKEKHDIIFEKFSRLSPSNRGVYSGEGLGLAIVKNTIQHLDGEIFIESDVGKGSVFSCVIPLCYEESASLLSSKPTASAASSSGSKSSTF